MRSALNLVGEWATTAAQRKKKINIEHPFLILFGDDLHFKLKFNFTLCAHRSENANKMENWYSVNIVRHRFHDNAIANASTSGPHDPSKIDSSCNVHNGWRERWIRHTRR